MYVPAVLERVDELNKTVKQLTDLEVLLRNKDTDLKNKLDNALEFDISDTIKTAKFSIRRELARIESILSTTNVEI